jgi:hypothetical protein
MTMPGFTADASLYKTNGRYQSVTTQSYNSVGGVVSQMRGDGLGPAVGPLSGPWCRCGPRYCCCLFLTFINNVGMPFWISRCWLHGQIDPANSG